MSHLTFANYEGYGKEAVTKYHYSQAVRIGDIIEISGQGGWDRTTSTINPSIPAQIEQAFDNVEHTLQIAGGTGWDQVFSVRSYHVGVSAAGGIDEESTDAFVKGLKKYCPNHQPLWTCVGVTALGIPDMKIEIEVRAHAPVAKK